MTRTLLYGAFSLLCCVVGSAVPHAAGTMAVGRIAETSGVFHPLITTSELVVGQNRLAFGLLKAHTLLEGAQVIVRLSALADSGAHMTAAFPAPYYPLEITAQGAPVHHHPDGTQHVHDGETAIQGLYVAQVIFPHPGPWVLEVMASQEDGTTETAGVTVMVQEAPQTVALGAAAPRSRNLIASDVPALRQIDTSQPPDPRLHQVRIADAIAQGKPQVLVFATPQFCHSQMCGPILEVVRRLLPVYGEHVVFTHQEIWQDFATRTLFPTVEEWQLVSEPWIFVVDGAGIVRAKFEGLVTVREVEAAIRPLLPHVPASRP